MSFVNLTPHAINIVNADGSTRTVPTSGFTARCAATTEAAGSHESVALSRSSFGETVGLPPPSPEVIFIVSGLVRSANSFREDLASPGELVRDSAGAVIGCRGLIVN